MSNEMPAADIQTEVLRNQKKQASQGHDNLASDAGRCGKCRLLYECLLEWFYEV